jgi:hypothetical protein
MDENQVNAFTAMIWAWLAYLTGYISWRKGRSFHVGFIWGSIFPGVATIIFLVLPKVQSRNCSKCGTTNPLNAQFCLLCGGNLSKKYQFPRDPDDRFPFIAKEPQRKEET